MTAATYDLVVDQGSDFAIDLTITEGGSAKNLTGYSGRAQMRSTHASSSVAATFTCSVINATAGTMKMEFEDPLAGTLTPSRAKSVIANSIMSTPQPTPKDVIILDCNDCED